MEWIKKILRPRTNYKRLYEEQVKLTEKYEFKYNTLFRQLAAIVKASDPD